MSIWNGTECGGKLHFFSQIIFSSLRETTGKPKYWQLSHRLCHINHLETGSCESWFISGIDVCALHQIIVHNYDESDKNRIFAGVASSGRSEVAAWCLRTDFALTVPLVSSRRSQVIAGQGALESGDATRGSASQDSPTAVESERTRATGQCLRNGNV